ncbi:hypothetical protein X805_30620 [Sphaerotilus natans subsp. natans DSM 6575]|jgi:hypothetical protein|uniref:Uncharacterized protein n=1 Tax=Sphaerotilus natans subsp. natans DSM 6575 TaxID=1286631 RepID=A0A059KIR6_9BURK|nr:hypothetical protein [Sphaerotilus natans]KDB51341.1 hypothetical protein X805_30620 [Sphaerotilus natans subsp. natans DSM 6575]SIR68979.1 hypothetical protein SAMN05421778_114104 [Sphaerotilus natans]
MLGLLVSELVGMVEARHGAVMADVLMFATDVPARDPVQPLDGYPAEQLEVLIDALARRTGEAPRPLVRSFASRLVRRIQHVHPTIYERHSDLLEPLLLPAEDLSLAPVRPASDLARREIEILFGDRREVQRLVDGLQQDIARYAPQCPAGAGRHAIVSDPPKRKFRQIPT